MPELSEPRMRRAAEGHYVYFGTITPDRFRAVDNVAAREMAKAA